MGGILKSSRLIALGFVIFLFLGSANSHAAEKCKNAFQKDTKVISGKLVEALRDGDKEKLKPLLPCKGRIGAWESEFDSVSQERFATYLLEKRLSQNSKKPLPLRLVREKGNSELHLVAIESFEFAQDITVPNNQAVFQMSKSAKGWKIDSMIETNQSSLDDVFLAQLDPKAYDKKYKK